MTIPTPTRQSSALAVAILLGSTAQADRIAPLPRPAAIKPARTVVASGSDASSLIVKFAEGIQVRLDRGELSASAPGLDRLLAELRGLAPDATLDRLFRRPEATYDAQRRLGEARTGKRLADLNNYYLLRLDAPVGAKRSALVCDLLNRHALVEIAYVPAPAADPNNCVDEAPATPDWTNNQSYEEPAPVGIDAAAAWAFGDLGRGHPYYWVIDVEQGWNVEHEDLNIDIDDVLNGPYDNEKRDHGTAVLGEIAGCDSGFGMTGIVPAVTLKTVDWNLEPTIADAFDIAASYLTAGEVYLIEIQTWGGWGYLPMEYEQANFDAIELHTALGVVVVEAGANGSQDLDDQFRYGQLFDRSYRDSGAILVGAGTPSNHAPEYFTNYGSRIDCQGYGSGVYSTGYGDLWEPEIDQAYTNSFSGTSSASPIVTGAAAATFLLNLEATGRVLTPFEVRDLLSTHGTPQGAPQSKPIGVLPDLAEIVQNLLPGYGWKIEMLPEVEQISPGEQAGMLMRLSNTEPVEATTQVWAEAILTGEDRWAEGRTIGSPREVTVPAQSSQLLSFSVTVPWTANLGTYVVTAHAGDELATPLSASFAHIEVQ